MIEAANVRSLARAGCPRLATALEAGDDPRYDRLPLSAVFETAKQCLLHGTPETINLVVVGLL